MQDMPIVTCVQKTSWIRSAVSMENRLVTDRETDRQTDRHLAIAYTVLCI